MVGSQLRAVIWDDGKVTDGNGSVLAYIESSGEVGDAHMNFVGKAHQSQQVTDHQDTMVGEFDAGLATVKDALGSVIAELDREGGLKDNSGRTVAKVEGFSYSQLSTMAAYVLLVDRDIVRVGPSANQEQCRLM